ncbi:MAG TPA: PBP1A family penicillin-binding protein [Patescibacteria group bacterium]|nr:PBP1A family penicillin-binding protein [Patescibacteria group bacterium]
MRLVVDLIVLLLWFLIKIGDFVLFAGETLVKTLAKFEKNTFKKIRKIKIGFPSLKRKRRIKRTVPKVVSIFPGPVPHFVKFKYFMLGSFFSFVLIYIPLLFLIFLQNLPNPRILALRDISQTTKIYDRNGILLYQIYANQNRTLVSLPLIPKDLINATIAIEDKDFYRNPGFDIAAIVRAAIGNIQGKPLQGGSTITQQLIKSTLLTPEQSLSRKIKEVILAFWSERIFTKDQILTMYFNQVSYGGTSWGVEAASQTYFGKDVSELDLAQSAFLAGLTKAPTTYYPYGDNPGLWKERQKEVLRRMVDLGYISKDEEQSAESEELTFLPPQSPIHSPHFVFYVKDYLINKYGLAMVEKGGLSVTTSLDLKLQENAEQIVRDEVDKDAVYNLTNGAALITNPKNGDILAMVGSKDYENPDFGKVNVTVSPRQPGSSVKPITYAAALSKGYTAATIIPDTPTAFGQGNGITPYVPVNYDGKFHGNVSLRVALGNSINIPAVKTLQNIGVPTMINLAKNMGITTWDNPGKYGLAVTLGAAEVKMTDMAEAYGTFANLGERVDLDPILKISDSQGNTIYEKKPIKSRVMDQGIAFIISSILSDEGARVMEFGTNTPLTIPGHDVSVKTGTSDSFRDNWTIGYTPSILTAVWVGNNDNQPMSGIASGITGAAPIWHNLMTMLLSKTGNQKIQKPDNVIQKQCLGRAEYFIKGTENSVNCTPIVPSPSPDNKEARAN